jgi:CRP-like cAMP-binding protein
VIYVGRYFRREGLPYQLWHPDPGRPEHGSGLLLLEQRMMPQPAPSHGPSYTDHPAERHRLVRKLESITDLTSEERQALLDLPMTVRTYVRDQDIVRDGDIPSECCLILEGFTCRYKLLPDGRRQIMAFHTPGDMPDLQSLHIRVMDHSVAALMPTSAAFIPHRSMRDLTERFPGLLHAFWRDTLIDAAIFREWMIGIGRRTAHERIAHLICEMLLRLRAVGLASNDTFKLPATQTDVADALGLSNVHVNRVLQDLRGDGLITWTRYTVSILKWEELQSLALFDATYLHQITRVAPDPEAHPHASAARAGVSQTTRTRSSSSPCRASGRSDLE